MNPLPPRSTIGILGGGQLGRMLAIAAAEMGYFCHIYTPEMESPASAVAKRTTVGRYEDLPRIEQFAQSVDSITYEFENIPVEAVKHAAQCAPLRPGAEVLFICQHRIREKDFLKSAGIATAPYLVPKGHGDFFDAQFSLGLPYIVKTVEQGYDGKGQRKITSKAEIELDKARILWNEEFRGTALIFEGFVDFSMELSVIVARSAVGELRCYPPVHNVHRNHILHQTFAPAKIDPALAAEAERIATRIAEGIGLVGILAVEMFLTQDGRLLVNEMAPRPHNSGHWTLDACVTSQFEQTIRAICGLPLGDTAPLCESIMTNLIGDEANAWPRHLQNPRAKLHLYGKAEARPGRKMGHVTELL